MHARLDTNDKIIAYLKKSTIYQGECWLYVTKSITESGHARVMIMGKQRGVHRLSANIFLGLELDNWDLQANHKLICPNKHCWNPDHLYVGTQKENAQDSIKAGTNKELRKTHCPQGHEYTKENIIIRYDHRSKQCRECTRLYQRRWKAAQKVKNLSNV